MLRTTWLYVLPTLTMFAAGQAAAQTPPADIVKKIYEQVTVFCNGADVAPPYTDKFMREVFDKPIADRYLTRLHKSQVDFDIFIDGQAGNAWVIADMRYRHRPFTLRSYLKLKPRA